MTHRTLTKAEIAAAFGVSVRTVTQWIADGCPSSRGPDGKRRLNHDEVARWRAAVGLTNPPPAVGGGAAEGAALPGAPRPTLETAELARKLTIARRNELELAAEKGLKGLGLAEQIREAKSQADLVEYTKRVIELVGSGAMTSERGRTLRGLVAETGRRMTARDEGGTDDVVERLILTTEEGGRLVAAFEGIVSDATRAQCLAFVDAAAARDREEHPNVDLAAGLDEAAGADAGPNAGLDSG